MKHATFLASVAALTGLTALAPTARALQVDASRIFPAPSKVRDAGVIDATTGARSSRSGSTKLGTTVVYNNTCSWTGGAFYAGLEPCEDAYDDGRVPSTGSTGIQDSHVMQSFTIGYCNFNGPLGASGTGADIEVAFFNSLGGTCVGGTPPTGPTGGPLSSVATAYFDLAGLGLPGSTAAGFAGCWNVTLDTSNTGWILQCDGDGTFDGTPALDNFSWRSPKTKSVRARPPTGSSLPANPRPAATAPAATSLPVALTRRREPSAELASTSSTPTGSTSTVYPSGKALLDAAAPPPRAQGATCLAATPPIRSVRCGWSWQATADSRACSRPAAPPSLRPSPAAYRGSACRPQAEPVSSSAPAPRQADPNRGS